MYYLFLFISSILRGMFVSYSLVFLYKNNIDFNSILVILFVMYFIGIFISVLSISKRYKIFLIVSVLLYSISFFLDVNKYLYLVVIFWSVSMYSYHAIRHMLSMEYGGNNLLVVVFMYIGSVISILIGINKLMIMFISFCCIFVILKMKRIEVGNYKYFVIDRKIILFFILEQFKVIFMELESLYLYFYVSRSVRYVGIYNILLMVMSLIVIMFMRKRINIKNFYRVIYLLAFLFIFKLNIWNKYIVLILSLIEGILVKMYEVNSLGNLYRYRDFNYLREVMVIFFVSKSFWLLIFILMGFNLKLIMYVCIIGMIVSGKVIKSIY